MKISKKKNITPKQESTLKAILESYDDANDIADEILACDVFNGVIIELRIFSNGRKRIEITNDDMLIVISG